MNAGVRLVLDMLAAGTPTTAGYQELGLSLYERTNSKDMRFNRRDSSVALKGLLRATALLLAVVCTLFASGNETRAQATVPAAPTGLTAPTVAHDSITLSWDDPGDSSITGYQVLRRSRDGDEYGDGRGAAESVAVVDDTGSSATTYTDTSVTARTRYVYRVKARSTQGLSEKIQLRQSGDLRRSFSDVAAIRAHGP